jgi:hypothetical protein
VLWRSSFQQYTHHPSKPPIKAFASLDAPFGAIVTNELLSTKLQIRRMRGPKKYGLDKIPLRVVAYRLTGGL